MTNRETTESDIRGLRRTLRAEDLDAARRHASALPALEVVREVERLDPQARAVLFRLLGKDTALAVFQVLDPTLQSELVTSLHDQDVAAVFAAMKPDDRVELLDELPTPVASRLLRGLPEDQRGLTDAVLGYPDDSIGRRMSPQYVSVQADQRVDEVLTRVRSLASQAEAVTVLPVVDGRRLVGSVHLQHVLAAPDDTRVADLIDAHLPALRASKDEESAARIVAAARVQALPVVDDENLLVGIVTVDDALRILEEAESEDISRQSGSEPLRRPYLATPVRRVVRSRVVWLVVLALGATLTIGVLETFEETLERMVVLGVFVPLIIGTGGNTGNQAATTVTRAIALGDVEPRDLGRVLLREMRTGFVLGLLLGLLGLVLVSVFYGTAIGIIIGSTILALCTVAAAVGGAMPLIAKKLGVDPAVFSNPFITTFVDATGLVIYFLIAQAVLGL